MIFLIHFQFGRQTLGVARSHAIQSHSEVQSPLAAYNLPSAAAVVAACHSNWPNHPQLRARQKSKNGYIAAANLPSHVLKQTEYEEYHGKPK